MTSLKASDVEQYLAANPDFFVGREALLLALKLPHGKKGSISLVERQVALFREQQGKSKAKLEALIANAEHNQDAFNKCSRLVLGLAAASDSAEFFAALEASLAQDFQCKPYNLLILGAEPLQINNFAAQVSSKEASKQVGRMMQGQDPTLGQLRPSELDFLFGRVASDAQSAAVLPVFGAPNQLLALLALGSEERDHFLPDMDTLFLKLIADTLARLLPKHLGSSFGEQQHGQ